MDVSNKKRTEIICQLDEIERLAGKIYKDKECDLFPRNIISLCQEVKLMFGYDRKTTILGED